MKVITKKPEDMISIENVNISHNIFAVKDYHIYVVTKRSSTGYVLVNIITGVTTHSKNPPLLQYLDNLINEGFEFHAFLNDVDSSEFIINHLRNYRKESCDDN